MTQAGPGEEAGQTADAGRPEGRTLPADIGADVEAAMDAAWPGLERDAAGGWVLRAAGGVTQRANSIWARADSQGPEEWRDWLRQARSWYRGRRLPVIFQIFDGPRSTGLNAFLDGEGFTRQSETLVLARGAVEQAAAPESVELSTTPSAEWLEVWWRVDGRGGEEALHTARAILEACPSVYALVRDAAGVPAAVGRLAVFSGGPVPGGTWGGVYCMATQPERRRRGYGSQVLAALLGYGASQGLQGYWLLVTAANHGAQELYARAGFREAGRYVYRQERPLRGLTAC